MYVDLGGVNKSIWCIISFSKSLKSEIPMLRLSENRCGVLSNNVSNGR